MDPTKTEVNSCVPEGLTVPVKQVLLIVLLLSKIIEIKKIQTVENKKLYTPIRNKKNVNCNK